MKLREMLEPLAMAGPIVDKMEKFYTEDSVKYFVWCVRETRKAWNTLPIDARDTFIAEELKQGMELAGGKDGGQLDVMAEVSEMIKRPPSLPLEKPESIDEEKEDGD